MANQGTPHGRNGNGNYNRDYDRDRDFISRQGRDRDDDRGDRGDESRDDGRSSMSRDMRDMRDRDRPDQGGGWGRDREREAYDRNNFGPTYSGSAHDRDRDRDHGGPQGQHSSRGSGDWGQYDDGRVTYGRRGEGQGFRESSGYRDDQRGRESGAGDRGSFGPQGGWNTEDRFGRRDEYQSNQDYGMRDREYGRGQSGYGAGNQPRDPSRAQQGGQQVERFSDWGRNERPGNYGVGARDSERADQLQRSYRGVGPQGYSRSDQRIQEDVSDTFTDDHHLDAANITVKVQGGEVTLTGTVADRQMKYRAEELAERVTGVKEIDNQLRVQKQQHEQRAGSRPDERGAGAIGAATPADDKAGKPKPS